MHTTTAGDQGQARPEQGAPSGDQPHDGARVRSPWGGAMVCTVPLADAERDGQGLAALEFLDLELPEPLGLALAASATSFKDCQANRA